MSANVFLIIIPNQKIVVADLIAGRKPDPRYGRIAKTRSTHNNYLTLPVLFLMISNHYPLAFATAVQLGHRRAGLHDRRADQALFQLGACAKGQSDLDLARGGRAVHPHHVAVDGPEDPDRRGKARRGGRRACRFDAFSGGARHGARTLQHVPCGGAGFDGIFQAPKGVILDTDAAIAKQCPRDLPAGRPQPCDAARQSSRE